MHKVVDKIWYGRSWLSLILWPSALFYQLISFIRRHLLKRRQRQFPVPLIVVGNITVGGVGKTPLVIAIAKACTEKGLRVGIVSRGYGARIKSFPHLVLPTDNAYQVGDEPLLIARRTNCPVVIAPNRCAAVDYLLATQVCDLIISDDGLQHYAMGRQVEIAVIDGLRGLGNGFCLPAGPLRESKKRLRSVDFIVVNNGNWPTAYQMNLQAQALQPMITREAISITDLTMPVAAVAGIGNPQRFFYTLQALGIRHNQYSFPDHHQFSPTDLQFSEKQIIMTEKDAVKCQMFAADNWYYLPVEAVLEEKFWQEFWSHKQIKGCLA